MNHTGRADRSPLPTAVTVMVSASLPPFLVGALAPRLDAEMPFGAAELGLVMACCYTVAGVLSPVGGRLVERLGPGRSARVVLGFSAVGLLGISAARSTWHVGAALLVAGLANALAQPTSNHLLARLAAPRHRALAFGLVQAAIPAAAVLAGAALGVTGRGVDWRAATLTVAACAIALQAVVPRRPEPAARVPVNPAPAPARTTGRTTGLPARLAPLVVTGTLGSAAASTLPMFVATAGVAQGLTAFAIAGAQMAGSTGSIAIRTVAPLLVSHAPAHHRFALMAGLLGVGAAGLLMLVPGVPALFMVGSVLGFAFGWGWNGLYNQLVASSAPGRVAAATGATQAGVFLGGTAGPALFAVLVALTGFSTAWVVMAVLMGAAALSALAGQAERLRPAPSPTAIAGKDPT